jgi:hypothetical protein
MHNITQHFETINVPTARDAYLIFVRGLTTELRLLLFGVAADAVTFRCPTNGRIYADDSPQRIDNQLWTKCYWCDTRGRVRGVDPDFDRSSPQPHCQPIVEGDYANA